MLTDDEIRAIIAYHGSHDAPLEDIYADFNVETIVELCTRVLASEARAKVLEDALRPFGMFADSYDKEVTVRHHSDDEEIYVREMNAIGKRVMTIGDCRHARKALEPSLSDLPHKQELSGMAHKPSPFGKGEGR